ncbi:MAG: hypothetical protein IH956_06390 [Chloroflexi bacterium]|nr:hypothetical protein [Chloroflexota bacterium]
MATEEQVQKVLNRLAEARQCATCGTSLRFGDLDCPHCGADIEDVFRMWAEQLLDDLGL